MIRWAGTSHSRLPGLNGLGLPEGHSPEARGGLLGSQGRAYDSGYTISPPLANSSKDKAQKQLGVPYS